MKIVRIALFMIITTTFLMSSCNDKLFSFTIGANANYSKIKIIDILSNIADTCKISIVFEDDYAKKIVQKRLGNIHVTNYTLDELLNFLLGDNNIFYNYDDKSKVLKIGYYKTKSFYIDYVSFTSRKSTSNKVINTGSSDNSNNNTDSTDSTSTTGGNDTTTMSYSSEFLFWKKIKDEINSILEREKSSSDKITPALINQDAGIVTVTGTKRQLNAVENYIKILMKRLHKQIMIEARIIEVQYNSDHTTGIDWSKFQLSLNGSSDATKSRVTGVLTSDGFIKPNYLVGYNFSMAGLLNFLKTQGDVKIVSNPKIMTLNNQPAVINVGTEINYRYDSGSTTTTSSGGTTTTPNYDTGSTFVGVTLDITPQISQNNSIILKINPVISAVAQTHIDSNGVPFLAPDIKIKQLSSIVKVKNNSKILIGGLISKNINKTDTKVPILSSIPILGNAFKSSKNIATRSELIIVIIPRIVDVDSGLSLVNYESKQIGEELRR